MSALGSGERRTPARAPAERVHPAPRAGRSRPAALEPVRARRGGRGRGRALFDLCRELAHTMGSRGVALYACSAEYVSEAEGEGDAYVRELRHLAKAIGAELKRQAGMSIASALEAHCSVAGDAYDFGLFAEALRLLSDELHRVAEGEGDPGGEAPPSLPDAVPGGARRWGARARPSEATGVCCQA
jgi:hypothetical protein